MSVFSRKLVSYLLSFVFLPVTLVGCGGSSDGPIQMPGQVPMADHSNVTYVRGVVTNAHPDSNTIMVGDDEVVVANATVSENGVVAQDAKPRVGDTVNLTVRRDTTGERFVAKAIDVSIVAQGPIDALNSALNTFTILGQTVNYSPTTVVGLPGGATLTAGMVVRVSGSVSGAGRVTATRVDYVSASYTPGTQLQVSGLVQGLNSNTRSFSLGTLRVDYSAVTLTTTLSDNMTVFVGATTLPAGGTLRATELSTGNVVGNPGTNPTGTIDPTISIRGPIELANIPGGTFNVMGQTVTFNQVTTVFPSGVNSTVVLGYVVRVTATPSTLPGQWTASRVEVVSPTYVAGTPVQVSGTVQNVNPGSRTFTLGTLSVNYTTVPNLTVAPFNGMSVIVGALSAPIGNTLTATELRTGTATSPTTPTNNIDLTASIRGPIESVSAVGGTSGTFQVMGQTVSFSTLTTFPNLQANTLVQGYVVRVIGTQSGIGGQWTASRVELVATSYIPGTPVQVTGTISNVDTINRRFTLGTLNVSYTSVTNLAFTPTNGMTVIVASTTGPAVFGGVLNATEMTTTTGSVPGGPIGSTLDPTAAIIGPIELAVSGSGSFTVMGQTVLYNATTQFTNGQAGTLIPGYVVRVTAAPSAFGGSITAQRVDLVSTSYVAGSLLQVSGLVSNVDNINRFFTLGTLRVSYATVLNTTVIPTNGQTMIVGARSLPLGGTLTATELLASTGTGTFPGTTGIDPTASVIGPVELVTPSVGGTFGGTFSVLGQSINFTSSTQFVTSTGATFILTTGNLVKVQTSPGAFVGQLNALRVELVSPTYIPGTLVQLSGTVQNVDPARRTFLIGTMTVSYATVLNATFTPTVGMSVIVASNTLPVGNVFNATAMTSSSGTVPGLPGTLPGTFPGVQPTVAVVTGTITTVLNPNEVVLTGVTVRISPLTQFFNGGRELMLPGMSIMVTGTLSGGLPNAYLDATMIRFSGTPIAGASRVQLRGPIEWIDVLNRRLSILGVTVTVPRSSIFVGDDDPDHGIDLTRLRAGMVVTVAGMGTSRQLNATFLAIARGDGLPRASDEDDEFQSRLPTVGSPLTGGLPIAGVAGVRAWMWAPLETVSPPMLSAFGIPVVTTASTAFFPAGHNTRVSSPSAFFGTATTGRTVRVEGVYTSTGQFLATRVCLVNSIRGSDFDGDAGADD